MSKHFEDPINIECRVNGGPFDCGMVGVWMSLAVHVRYPLSALESGERVHCIAKWT